MSRVAIADYEGETVEVDLWGTIFEVVRVTKKTEGQIDEALDKINKRAQKLDLTKASTQVQVFAERMDVWLKPIAGGKKKASTVIQEKWDAGQLTPVQIDRFWENVQEAVTNRPI